MAREDDDHCCRSPQQEFAIRNNDGGAPLSNDTRLTIALPAGDISREGMQEILRYLALEPALQELSLDEVGVQWRTDAGTFTKRLSNHVYKAHHRAKLSTGDLSYVGGVARDHSQPVDVTIDVTRRLNLSSAAFANDGSCWWSSYRESRCALKTNGGFGLRTHDVHRLRASAVTGRAWVMPLRRKSGRLLPTFDSLTPDAFVMFNGYGDLSSYAAPRIMAHLYGWTYRKINFACNPMFINSGGYLIMPEDFAESSTRTSLDLSLRQHADLFAIEQAEQAAIAAEQAAQGSLPL